MSKNIAIQEGGIGKQLTVDKLKTNLVGGGSCLWVPEDGTHLGTKYISENGTYKASADGYYGYSEVTVSGVGTATGKDSDGDEATVSPDPSTGALVTTKKIESIGIVTPPTVLTYQDGAAINFGGLSVHGYSTTGKDLGDITNKCIFPVTVADYSQGTESGEVVVEGLNRPIYLISVGLGDYIEPDGFVEWMPGQVVNIAHYISAISGSVSVMCMAVGETSWMFTFLSTDYFTLTHQRQIPPGWSPQITNVYSEPHTYNGHTGYVGGGMLYDNSHASRFPIGAAQEISVQDTAIAALFGGVPVGGVTQTIPIQYVRDDMQTLETSFSITVTQGA